MHLVPLLVWDSEGSVQYVGEARGFLQGLQERLGYIDGQ